MQMLFHVYTCTCVGCSGPGSGQPGRRLHLLVRQLARTPAERCREKLEAGARKVVEIVRTASVRLKFRECATCTMCSSQCRGVHGHMEGEMPWAFCDECVDGKMAELVGESQFCIVFKSCRF